MAVSFLSVASDRRRGPGAPSMSAAAVRVCQRPATRRAGDNLSFRPSADAMTIALSKEAHQQAVASVERYFEHARGERIGNIAAAALLNFFLEEIGPSIYNRAVADVQERLQARVSELDIEVHADEFGYWRRREASARKGRR